jgi:hypothetical protein
MRYIPYIHVCIYIYMNVYITRIVTLSHLHTPRLLTAGVLVKHLPTIMGQRIRAKAKTMYGFLRFIPPLLLSLLTPAMSKPHSAFLSHGKKNS